MQDDIIAEVIQLKERFGARALAEAKRLLDAATAARNYKAGMFYAEVCGALGE